MKMDEGRKIDLDLGAYVPFRSRYADDRSRRGVEFADKAAYQREWKRRVDVGRRWWVGAFEVA